jgi:hypothetical protein
LWLARLDDYDARRERLTPADLTNRKTHDAGHNARPIGALLSSFRRDRERLVARLDELEEGRWGQSALHPRLETPMRVLDHAFFVAEHDDHHMARIRELAAG